MRRFAQKLGLGGVELAGDVEPQVAALRATPDDFRSSLGKLAEAVRECSPALRHVYTEDRLRELLGAVTHAFLAIAWGVDPEQYVAVPDSIDHFLPDNPLTITPEGAVAGWESADMPHFQQLRDHRTSLRPPGQLGRPPKEEALARKVYAMVRAGQHWTEIVRAVGLRDKEGQQYNLYDSAARKSAYSHYDRLRHRGRLLANQQAPAHESP